MNEGSQIIKQKLETAGLTLNEKQSAQLLSYYTELVRQNEHMNLTAITEFEEVLDKHFADSLAPLAMKEFNTWLKQEGRTILDMGTGAGFPGLPLAIVLPEARVTLADSLKKRTSFLYDTVQMLELDNVQVVNGRAEDLAKEAAYRENFDLVVSRAVADLPVLCEYCLPFVSVGGLFIAWKGPGIQEEVQKAKDATTLLGGAGPEIYDYTLPGSGIRHSLAVIRKTANTPDKYPRRAGIPTKRPLGSLKK